MQIEVRYVSRGGNTKRLADAIAGAVGATAHSVDTSLGEKTDLLFLGGAIYAGELDENLKRFIAGLSPEAVARAAVFSTAARKKPGFPLIRELLELQGIPVDPEGFHCPGQFLLAHRGRPNSDDLHQAARFARSCVE